jgi:hypothetical protein
MAVIIGEHSKARFIRLSEVDFRGPGSAFPRFFQKEVS